MKRIGLLLPVDKILLGLLVALTAVFFFTDLDMMIQRQVFHPEQEWPLGERGLWRFMEDYGRAIPVGLAIGALAVLVLGFVKKWLASYRRAALLMVLLMLIGPGLLVDQVLKPYWERPRPHEVEEFGGEYEFVPVWMMGEAGPNSSFPSGHSSLAFYMMFPYFLFRRRNRPLAYLGLALGIGFGSLMGVARIFAGMHFATDVIWAFGVVYLTGLLLSPLCRSDLAGTAPHAQVPQER
ncbi:MAG: phosphatase PAP2 family protein [Candidatus Bipolaricaulota bacterium]